MYSIMNEHPDPASKYNPDITPDMERVIERALEKEPEDRYQHMDDLVSELRRSQKKSSRITSPGSGANVPVPDLTGSGTGPGSAGPGSGGAAVSGTPSSARIPASVGIGPVSAVSAAPESIPVSRKKKFPVLPLAGIGALAIAVALYFLVFTGKGKKIDSLAVLPFVNVSGNPEIEYLTEGVTDYLTNKLSQMPGLRVLPSSFVAKYRASSTSPQAIGSELSVGAILTGRVTERNGRLSVQTELIDVGQVSQLWGERYEKDLGGIQDLQADIVAKVTNKLGVNIGSEESANLVRGSTKNTEAYQLYLKGRYQWNKRNAEGIRAAVGYFQKAIELDPNFALAYIGLAQTYIFPESEDTPGNVRLPKIKAAADRALEIDDQLAEAHSALGSYYLYYELDIKKGGEELRRATELDPKYPTGLHWYAEYLCFTGHFDDGLAMYRKAVDADPLSLAIATDFGLGYYVAREYDSAATYLEKILKTDPEYVRTRSYLYQVYLARGDDEKAYRILRDELVLSGMVADSLRPFDEAWKRAGIKGITRRYLGKLMSEATPPNYPSIFIAEAYITLGKEDSALVWIRRAIDERDPFVSGLGADPRYDPIRSNPEFHKIIRELGYEEIEKRSLARVRH
ncbi:MAG TPA: tetratricopeptide repeat protein, partial [Bacteroidota bacterium]|nr:tetratricopeptide repeat protein [Bacteroidota bacterium]